MDGGLFVGVILAAGFSSRMGDCKALLPIGDVIAPPVGQRSATALGRLIGAFREAGVDKLVVVSGHDRARVAELALACGACEAYNPDYADGMFSSVKSGIRAANSFRGSSPHGISGGILLIPVDTPLVSARSIASLIDAHFETPNRFIAPCFMGKKGHPLLIPWTYADAIVDFAVNSGVKAFISEIGEAVRLLETGDEGAVLDMDTPQDYAEILACSRDRRQGAYSLKDAGFRGRLFLVRHGETERHAEKIFLGQYDVPLSARGRTQAAGAAELLADCGARFGRIYTSDLKRAVETAQIIAGRYNSEPEIRPMPELREMSLGDWDGRFIREIREEFPAEFEKRGRDILHYKRPGGENFFDLRYRVVKRIVTLPQEGDFYWGDDVLIVAHSGVIRAVIASLPDAEPDADWKREIPLGAVWPDLH